MCVADRYDYVAVLISASLESIIIKGLLHLHCGYTQHNGIIEGLVVHIIKKQILIDNQLVPTKICRTSGWVGLASIHAFLSIQINVVV